MYGGSPMEATGAMVGELNRATQATTHQSREETAAAYQDGAAAPQEEYPHPRWGGLHEVTSGLPDGGAVDRQRLTAPTRAE